MDHRQATIDQAARALRASHLGSLPDEVLARLTEGSRHVRHEAGSISHREGDPEPHLDVIVSGFARVFVAAPDGRTMTVRYCRPGAILGAISLFSSSFAMPATVQSILPTDHLVLDPTRVRALAAADPMIAGALLTELSERVDSFIAEISRGAFSTVRQRIARHLLDLASERQTGATLVATVSQQDLAESVGTAREVVVRILRELRSEGIVQTARRGITISDPVRLYAETYEVARNM